MKKAITFRFAARVFSFSLIVLSVSLSYVIDTGRPFVECLFIGISSGLSAILFYPGLHDDARLSLQWQLCCGAVNVGLIVFRVPLVWHLSFLVLCTLAFAAFMNFVKYRKVEELFASSAVWRDLQDKSRLLWAAFYGFVALLTVGCVISMSTAAVLLSVLYVHLYMRVYAGRSSIIPMSVEKRLRDAIAEDRRIVASPDEDMEMMLEIYDKVLEYMKDNMPYLRANYRMEDLAQDIATNRTYLSRTINKMAGKGFPQFLNTYRVEHALALIESDPHIKVKDLALRCGYNNSVTFTLAFESIVHETPGMYCQNIILSQSGLPPSNQKGQEQ